MCSSAFTAQVKILSIPADSLDNFVSKYIFILFICPVPYKVKKQQNIEMSYMMTDRTVAGGGVKCRIQTPFKQGTLEPRQSAYFGTGDIDSCVAQILLLR